MALGLVLVDSLVLLTPRVSAQTDRPDGTSQHAPAALELSWEAPPGCPNRADVLERIRALAGPAIDETTNGLSARGAIKSVDGRFRLTLTVPEGPELRQRVIESDVCAELAGAAAISVALLLGIELPEGGPADPKPIQTPSTEEQVPKEARPVGSTGHDQPRGSETGERWDILLQGPVFATDMGLLPSPSVGPGFGVGTRHGPWRAVLTGVFWAPQDIELPHHEGVGADVQRMTGRLMACRGWRSASIEIAPCIGLATEFASARGFGARVSARTPWAVWPAPGAGVFSYGYISQSLAFFVGASGYVELARPRITIEGLGEIAQLGPASVGGTLGLEWIL